MYTRRWISLSWILTLCLLMGACSPQATEEAATNNQPAEDANSSGIQNVSSSFTEGECEFDQGGPGFGGNMICGTLEVPEERSNPDSPTLKQQVVIFKSTGTEPVSDPLFITFGPVYMGFSYFFGYTRLFGGYLDKRDLVILDPRGTGREGLELECQELNDAFLGTLELEFNSESVRDTWTEAAKTCRARGDSLVTSIANLNIVEMAEDFEELRQALGYEKVNVQALGTGARIAEIWAARHPDSIRTITFVSPVPLADNIYIDQVKAVDRTIQSVFQECAANENCNKAYPNLDIVFPQLAQDLNAHPLNVEVNYLTEGTHYSMQLNGDRLIDLAYVMATSGYPEWIGYLPQIIYETKAGNTAQAAEALNQYIDYTAPSNAPLTQGIWCDEILPADAQTAIQAEIDQQPAVYAGYFKNMLKMQTAFCEVWGERTNRPDSTQTTQLTIPTLFLTSNSDLIAPATISDGLTNNYTPAFIYELSGAGGVQALTWWDCWSKLQTAFMNDPSIPPQETCVNKKPTISWITFKP